MPYLNLDLDYFIHPKISRLVGLLGRGAAELPIRLWTYCGKFHCESGNLAGYSAQEIESVVGWWGAGGKMVEAMLSVGLIEKTSDGFKIHDWLDHAGHLSAFKKRAKTAAKKRWNNYASSNAKEKSKQCSLPTLPTKPKELNTVQAIASLNEGQKKGKVRSKSKEKVPPNYQPEWVDIFWNAYPRRSYRPNVNRAFSEINPDKDLFDKIMGGLDNAKTSKEWLRENGDYIPQPGKWLSLRGWENEYKQAIERQETLL